MCIFIFFHYFSDQYLFIFYSLNPLKKILQYFKTNRSKLVLFQKWIEQNSFVSFKEMFNHRFRKVLQFVPCIIYLVQLFIIILPFIIIIIVILQRTSYYL